MFYREYPVVVVCFGRGGNMVHDSHTTGRVRTMRQGKFRILKKKNEVSGASA